jgi:hypothetical protein
MNQIAKFIGSLLILIGFSLLGLSVISSSDTQALTSLGIILTVIGIGLLVTSKTLGDKEKRNCNCCKCSNCSLDHDHWSHD